jgi:TRAP-type transport system periplasmic protein
MKRLSIKTIPLCLALFTVLALAAGYGQAAEKPIEMSFSHIWPPTSFQQELYAKWAQRIEKETNGRVKITLYPVGTLCPPPEMWNAIRSGAATIGSAFASYHQSGFDFNNSTLPFWIGGPPSIEWALKTMDGFRAKYPALSKEFTTAHVLWISCHGPRELFSTKPVRVINDLKSLKLRAASPLEVDVASAFGAVVVPRMPMNDVYSALQKKIIDGVWTATEVLKTFRMGEVIKYVTRMNFEVGQNKYVAMNLETWNKLPPDIQQVFEKASEWAKWEDVKLWNQADIEGEQFAKSLGVEFIDLPPSEYQKMMSIIDPIKADAAKKLDAKGYPATALLNDINAAVAKARSK